jgi:hypothetical protein
MSSGLNSPTLSEFCASSPTRRPSDPCDIGRRWIKKSAKVMTVIRALL